MGFNKRVIPVSDVDRVDDLPSPKGFAASK